MTRYCKCKYCKVARRKGKVLGQVPGLFHYRDGSGIFRGMFDAYVPWPKFARKGSRRPVRNFRAELVDQLS